MEHLTFLMDKTHTHSQFPAHFISYSQLLLLTREIILSED